MKLLNKIFLTFFILLGTVYLLLPSPDNFPDLPGAVKSIEPGDTTQMANVSAYYTDMPRQEVVNFYFTYFSRSPFLNLPLLTYKLNHPPERIREVLRDTQQSTYVEEIVHPFMGSVFVNGFEWNNDPFTPPKSREQNILVVDGKTYQFKVTIFYQESKVWQRLIIFYLATVFGFVLIREIKQLIRRFQKSEP